MLKLYRIQNESETKEQNITNDKTFMNSCFIIQGTAFTLSFFYFFLFRKNLDMSSQSKSVTIGIQQE